MPKLRSATKNTRTKPASPVTAARRQTRRSPRKSNPPPALEQPESSSEGSECGSEVADDYDIDPDPLLLRPHTAESSHPVGKRQRNLSERDLLKPINQGAPYFTPTIKKIVDPWLQYSQPSNGKLDPAAQYTFPPARKMLSASRQRCEAGDKRCKIFTSDDGLGCNERTITGIKWMDLDLQLGDHLIVTPDHALKPSLSRHKSRLLDDGGSAVDLQFWFGRLVQIQLLGSSPRTTLNAVTSVDNIRLHIHYYVPAQATFMGSIARANELFLTPTCGDVKLKHVLGQFLARELETDEAPPSPSDTMDFFYVLQYNESDMSFSDLPDKQVVDAAIKQGACPNCLITDSTDNFFPDVALVNQQGYTIKGHQYHLHDFVKIQEFLPSGRLVQCCEYVRKSGLISSDGSSPSEYCLVQICGNHVCFQADNILGPIEVQFVSNGHPPDDRFFYEESWDQNNKFSIANQHRKCDICIVNQQEKRNIIDQRLSRGPLKVLDLFAGGGGFSQGLCANGRVSTAMAVDISPSACDTLRKNLPEDAVVVNTCVNNFLQHHQTCLENCSCEQIAIREKLPNSLPKVDMIALGPSCQQISPLNRFAHLEQGEKNLTVFTGLSFVDKLQPDYVVLENVPAFYRWSIRNGKLPHGGLSLTLTCLFAMRYQVRFGILDALHYGAPQRRRRFFLLAAKRGLKLPHLPQPVFHGSGFDRATKMTFQHDSTTDVRPVQASFGIAEHFTPTIWESISDLPAFNFPDLENYDSEDLYCVPPQNSFQRHCRQRQLSRSKNRSELDLQHFTLDLSTNSQNRVMDVPMQDGADYNLLPISTLPQGLNAPESARARDGFRPGAYGRAKADSYFRTITTNFTPMAKQSVCLHPKQERIFSLRELARGQTFRDEWEFVSHSDDTKDQLRQIGNAVPPVIASSLEEEIFKSLLY